MEQNKKKRVRKIGHWEKDEIIELIKFFGTNAHLWDTSRIDYKFRNKRQASLQEISKQLNKDPENCANKWNSLRVHYNSEKKKMVQLNGETKWEFFNYMSFLNNLTASSSKSNTHNRLNNNERKNLKKEYKDENQIEEYKEDESLMEEYEGEHLMEEPEDEHLKEDENLKEEHEDLDTLESTDSQSKSITSTKKYKTNSINIGSSKQKKTIFTKTFQIVNSKNDSADSQSESTIPTKKYKTNSEDVDFMSNQKEAIFKRAFQIMNTRNDSAQIFGDFVADQLRQLNKNKSRQLQRIIQREILNFTTEFDEILIDNYADTSQPIVVFSPSSQNNDHE